MDWTIRRGRPDDARLIFDSWTRSLARALARAERRDDYLACQKQVIAALLEVSQVWIACDPEDEETIFGWLCGEPGNARTNGSTRWVPTFVHYVYVRKPYREAGVARSLLRKLLEQVRGDPDASGQFDGVVATECPDHDVYRTIKRKHWGLARRRPYYHAMARERERQKLKEAQ